MQITIDWEQFQITADASVHRDYDGEPVVDGIAGVEITRAKSRGSLETVAVDVEEFQRVLGQDAWAEVDQELADEAKLQDAMLASDRLEAHYGAER